MNPVIPPERISVFATGLDHPECLCFDRNGLLYCGGEAGQVYEIGRDGGAAREVCALGGFSGGMAWTPDDAELLVCNPLHGLVMVKRDGSHRVFATHAGGEKLVCPNYPVFAPDGSVLVTDSGNWRRGNGRVCRFTSDGKSEVILAELGYANGLALWRGSTLFCVESDTNSVHLIALGAHLSVTKHARLLHDVGRLPDGLALDDQGRVYVSCYASDEVWRCSADGSQRELLAWDPFAIVLSRPTNMAWGGEAMDELYFANLGRTTITRVKVEGARGERLANQR